MAVKPAIGALVNGGTLRIYSGSEPATCDTALVAQVLLAEMTFSATAFAAAGTFATAGSRRGFSVKGTRK